MLNTFYAIECMLLWMGCPTNAQCTVHAVDSLLQADDHKAHENPVHQKQPVQSWCYNQNDCCASLNQFTQLFLPQKLPKIHKSKFDIWHLNKDLLIEIFRSLKFEHSIHRINICLNVNIIKMAHNKLDDSSIKSII